MTTYYTKQEANHTVTHYCVEDGVLYVRHGMSCANVLADNVPWEISYANQEIMLAKAVEVL